MPFSSIIDVSEANSRSLPSHHSIRLGCASAANSAIQLVRAAFDAGPEEVFEEVFEDAFEDELEEGFCCML